MRDLRVYLGMAGVVAITMLVLCTQLAISSSQMNSVASGPSSSVTR